MKKFLGTLYFFIFLLFLFPNFSVLAETRLFLKNNIKQIEEGDRVTIEMRVNAQEQSINAVTGSLSFSSDFIRLVSVSKENSIVNFWTEEPRLFKDKILFEGVILNPGFEGSNGLLFKMTFEARKEGFASIDFFEGGVLANDGLGSNVLTNLNGASFLIKKRNIASVPPSKVIEKIIIVEKEPVKKVAILPVITDYPPIVDFKRKFSLKGYGEPNANTRIVFKEGSVKSLGEKFIEFLQTKRKKLNDVLVKNDENGLFEYVSPQNIVAGVYNATPFLVDEEENLEKPGFGAQLLVSDSKIVKFLVILINVLGLLIPIVILLVIIYFIPWYSWLRMKVIKKKIDLEEEKVEISEHQLVREDKLLDKKIEKIVGDSLDDPIK